MCICIDINIKCFSIKSILSFFLSQRTEPGIKALWLETFTNSLKGMLHKILKINAKHEFAGNFFPPRGALPPRDFGSLLGLEFGTSILHWQVDDLAFTLSIVWPKDGSSINNSFPAFTDPSPIARTKQNPRMKICMIQWKENPRNSEQQRRRALCGTSMTFLSTHLSRTSAMFTLPTRI